MNEKTIAVMLPRLSRRGGVELQAWRIADELARSGFQPTFICARAETEPPEGVRVVIVGRRGGVRALKMLWFAWAAERERRRGAYDLTISLGKTIRQDVLRVSGGPQTVFRRLSRRAYEPGPDRWLKDMRRRLDPASWVTSVIERVQLRSASVVVAVSPLTLTWMREAYPEDKYPVLKEATVIANRPDLSRYSPAGDGERERLRAAAGIDESVTLAGFASTAFARKGLMTLIRAMKLLPQSFHLTVAGDRRPGRFGREAERLGIRERIHFMGHVADMPAFYRSLDVFALPSHYDTCSNALLEAMACGVPVVGSADDGSSRFLDERFVIRDTEDPKELAAAILETSEQAPAPFLWPGDEPAGPPAWVELVRNLFAAS